MVNFQGVTIAKPGEFGADGVSGSNGKNGTGFLPSVFFDLGSATVKPNFNDRILVIARVLQANPKLKVKITGNCDIRGNENEHIKLGQRPFTGNNHISEKFSAGRSERRDGFEQVFIQNIDLKPSECGSPVFDLNKKLVAINIARYSRVGTLAIPGNKVLEFLKAAIAQP